LNIPEAGNLGTGSHLSDLLVSQELGEFGATMRCMKRCLLPLCVTIALLSCSQPTTSRKPIDNRTSALNNRVPAADPSKYRAVRDARDWQNPYLVVYADGIDARPISAATEAPRMSPAEVVGYLEKLPSIAWPYGLVVAMQESGVRAPGDNAQIRKNAEELQRLLTEAGVKVELWPSA